MLNTDQNKHSIIYGIIVAVVFGLVGFGVNFFDIQLFESRNFKISILLGLLFPLLIAQAWGWRYGLLSALAGGCQTMWWLWRSDGYGFLYAVPVFTVWVVWHGYWTERRQKADRRRWYYSAFVVEIPFRILSELGFYTIFRWLVSLNPPPWDPSITWDYVSLSWINIAVIKHIITAYLLLLAARVLLSFAPVRRFFGLKKQAGERIVGAIYAGALLMGALLWIMDSVVDYLAFNPQGQTFWDVTILNVSPQNLFMRNTYVLTSVITGVFVTRLVAKRAQAEAALRESESKFRALYNNSPDMHVSVSSDDASILLCNETLLKETGYTREEIIGSPIFKIYHDDCMDKVNQTFQQFVETGRIESRELILKRKDGSKIDVSLNVNAVKDDTGKILYSISSWRDITERKKAQKNIAQLSHIFEDSLNEIYLFEADTLKFTQVNNAAQHNLGYTMEEFRQFTPLELKPEFTAESFATLVEPLRKGKKKKISFETLHQRKDGSLYNVEVHLQLLEYARANLFAAIILDITERAQAEAALRANEAKLQSIFSTSPFGIGLVKDRKLGWSNDRMYTMIGYPIGSLLGKSPRVLYENDEEYERVGRILYESIQEKGIGKAETRWRRKDGSVIDCNIQITLLNTADPSEGNIVTAMDITERVRAQEEIVERQMYLEGLLRSTPDAIVTLDILNQVVEWNLGAEKLFGYSQEEVVGQNLDHMIATPNGIEEATRFTQRVLRGKDLPPTETVRYRKDNSPVNVIVAGSPILVRGELIGAVAVYTDITERVQVEESLQDSKDRLQKIMIAANDGMWDWNIVTNEVYFDPRYYEMAGYNIDEFPHRLEEFEKRIHPDDIEFVMGEARKHLNGEVERFIVEFRFKKKDEDWLWVMGRGVIIERDESKAPLRFVGTHTDITERKQAEKKLEQYRDQLEELVAERTQELRDAQEKLIRQERLAALGQIAGGIGHELRNPLGVISNAVYYLKMVLPNTNIKINEYLEMINSETQNAAKIISDLLGFARIKSVDCEDTALFELVSSVLAKYPPPENVEVNILIPNDLPSVYVDPAQIGQVLANMIANAYQAMPDGGELTVSSEESTVADLTSSVLITITDTGVGILPENMGKIFEPLFTTKPRGIGLGLPISEKLVEAHGGNIEVESVAGEGSAFTVRLPLK